MSNYPIGDFIIRLKNAALSRRQEVVVTKTKSIKSLALVLKDLGYLLQVEDLGKKLKLRLKYQKKEPLLTDAKIISKPGLRVYKSVEELQRRKGPSIAIVSTSKGIMSSKEAIKKRIGGEVIAEIL